MEERKTFPVFHSKMRSDLDPKNSSEWQKPENYEREDVTLEGFKDLCITGHSWRGGIYRKDSNSFEKENALYSITLSLEFNRCDKSPLEMFDYSKRIGIPFNFYYFTYRDTSHLVEDPEEYSYRIVWVLNEKVSKEEFNVLERGLTKDVFFSFNPNKKCRMSSICYGGNSFGEVLNDELTDKKCMFRTIGYHMLSRGAKKRNLERNRGWRLHQV